MSRVFARTRIWTLPEQHLEPAGRLIAAAARERGPIDAVVGIAQGGLVPARLLAALLDAEVFEVTARHNTSGEAFLQATGLVECDEIRIEPGSLSGRVLIVDDICGTGATLRAVSAALAPAAAPGAEFATATLCRNIGAEQRPDIHVWDVDDWVHFPWEAPPESGTPRAQLPWPREIA